MYTFAVSRNLMKYAVCTNVIQSERKRIVSATIRLIIHMRTRIIIVQFLHNIARTIVIRAATLPSASVIPPNVQFFFTLFSRTQGVHRSIPRTYSFRACSLKQSACDVYTLAERQHFTYQCKS